MNEYTRNQKGSPNRDAFKRRHKDPPFCKEDYACDADLFLFSKDPPEIIALQDYKTPRDSVSYGEVVVYNHQIRVGIPVFILVGPPPFDSLKIYRYWGGDFAFPPNVDLRLVKECMSIRDWADWEHELRRKHHRAALDRRHR